MSSRPEFERPKTVGQAIRRLPACSHPEYEKEGGSIEHLVHLRSKVIDLIRSALRYGPDFLSDSALDTRWIPLEVEDVQLLEQLSFYRDLENAVTVQWEYIRKESEWANYYSSGDDQYQWWQISEMIPPLTIQSSKLVCVETNYHFLMQETNYRTDENSEFDIYIFTPEELNSLLQELTRNE